MESTITAPSTQPQVTVGVDTHKHVHVAHAVDQLGRPLGSHRIAVNALGYRELVSWARRYGPICQVGIEGPGHYGAGLARHLRAEGIHVTEVGRPKKQRRARYGKTDEHDAAGAAAIVLAGEALGEPKTADGPAEMVRILRVARASAVRARGKAFLALKDLIVTALEELREELSGVYRKTLIYACRMLVIPEMPCTPTDATKIALKSLAARCYELDAETERLGHQIDVLTAAAVPALRSVYGVGPDCAATLLSATGDNPHRLRSDAAFAKLCGVSPIEASSGKVVRHRLNRGGNRDANRALHTILVVRMRRHQPTRDYIARRLADGKTRKEAMRCLKRYIAREVFHALQESSETAPPT
ncbi:transposase [Mycobacteroides abscessus subsp. abscessus]|uniref:IS110 family transposase n=1 Tax=Mycobacteroides abscessus TaxID=36809 RepID=UPI00092A473C|nr:IS110 family transposase [Mycobacteroides abscessus]MDM2351264.1 IS110 family transposase [Mycobacteroides abscessus]MDM2361350.1 IS110 family transposase [Mycobacteroides abscessus]QSN53244.1 IS110 family transposase [Mycobacteroides abscessus subsp. abscessus]SII21482.1 transposase [Mycobacteroides abscessus subsp. abscessus]SII81592.1 transposase [Mycobacteroides abscessus subsp. abscessus]